MIGCDVLEENDIARLSPGMKEDIADDIAVLEEGARPPLVLGRHEGIASQCLELKAPPRGAGV